MHIARPERTVAHAADQIRFRPEALVRFEREFSLAP